MWVLWAPNSRVTTCALSFLEISTQRRARSVERVHAIRNPCVDPDFWSFGRTIRGRRRWPFVRFCPGCAGTILCMPSNRLSRRARSIDYTCCRDGLCTNQLSTVLEVFCPPGGHHFGRASKLPHLVPDGIWVDWRRSTVCEVFVVRGKEFGFDAGHLLGPHAHVALVQQWPALLTVTRSK